MTRPILWWKAENTPAESMAGVDAVWSETPAYAPGAVGQAFDCDVVVAPFETKAALSVANNSRFNFDPTGAFSIRLWFKLYDYTTSDVRLIYKRASLTSGVFDWVIWIYHGGITITMGSTTYATTGAVSDNGLHEILLTFTNGTGNIYLDSTNITILGTWSFINNSSPLFFSVVYNQSTHLLLDEVRFYDEVITWDNDDTQGAAYPGNKITANKPLLGFKLETTPYVAETLAADDHGHLAHDVQVTTDVEVLPRVENRGDYSRPVSVSGRRLLAINFKVDLYAHPTPATAPRWFQMLRACGWEQTTHGSTGVSIRPGKAREPATIEVPFDDESSEPRQLVYKAAGAVGNVKITGGVGRPMTAEFSFLGRFEGITTRAYASRVVPSGFDSATPRPLLNANCLVMGRPSRLDEIEVSSNEVINPFSDLFKAAGFGGGLVADRFPFVKFKIGGMMSLTVTHIGGVVAIGYDDTTGERGFLTKLVNGTGSASVKGTLVSISPSADSQVVAQTNEFDTIGVVAEGGVANGSEMWVWKNGSRAQVLYKDSTAATRGNVLLAADTDGRAIDVAVPSSNPVVAQHFKECGHVYESKSAGTNVLVLADLHFN